MFRNGLQAWHVIVLLVVIVLLFGANRLPGVAKSVGQSMKIFRNEMRDLRDDESKPDEKKTGTNGTSGEGSTGDDRSPKA
ncbi:twin-arginine translocase TatA/TatE family subunit [Cellulomonas alba]|uniref:Sec-independent protein translocase protein TatA n=1 Tax=Cellulomonas alba TaxID=3053467 RepID=A0ABT7SAZ3_9CELL|nr:twin-arginine translocase TatA/TatE family subunit [Cellulomonas alba]MDM7853360.1 twin-arginine translocase TatA/TatE family subunit [Cellulomonas alba]